MINFLFNSLILYKFIYNYRSSSFGSGKNKCEADLLFYNSSDLSVASIGKVYNGHKLESIWCGKIYHHQESSEANIFLGGDKSFQYGFIDQYFSTSQILLESIKTKSSVLCCDFANKTRVLYGQRNGEIRFYDVRGDPNKHCAMNTSLIAINTAVTNISSVKEHFLVVSGLGNYLQLYDLRYIQLKDTTMFREEKIPLVYFKGYSNKYNITHGLSVNLKDILAVAGDNKTITFYNISTGDKLNHLYLQGADDNQDICRKLEWDSSGIFANIGNRLEYWETSHLTR